MTDEPRRTEDASSFIEVEFICTDRGEHRSYRLLQAMVGPGPDDFDPLTNDTSFTPADRESLFGGGTTYDRFFCAGCGRNPQIRHDKFLNLLRRLHQEGVTEVDVSLFPF